MHGNADALTSVSYSLDMLIRDIAKAAFLTALIGGCGIQKTGPFTPATATVGDDGFGSALRTLAESGYTITSKDRDGGVIQTEWESSTTLSFTVRYRWVVTIADNVAVVASQCETKDDDPGPFAESKWEKCEAQASSRNKEAKALASKLR